MKEKIKFIIRSLFSNKYDKVVSVIDMNNGEQSSIFFDKYKNIVEIEYPFGDEDNYEYIYAIYDRKNDVLICDENIKIKYVIEEFYNAIKEKKDVISFK